MNDSPSLFDQSLEPKKPKSREVSSRYLSSTTNSPSPSLTSSPVRHRTSTNDTRKHRSVEDSGFIRGLWPSSSPSHPSSDSNNVSTLADHLGNDRLKDFLETKKGEKSSEGSNFFSLSRQRSCSEFNRFENENETSKLKSKEKENHRPILGGSMRYTEKLRGFSGKLSSPSSTTSSALSSNDFFTPGRLSVDENVLYQNSKLARRKSENPDTESETSDGFSASLKPRKSGIEVSSKFLQTIQTKTRRSSSDSNIQHPVSLDASPKMKKSRFKSAIKRANSLTGTSQWALSPGRSGSPPMSVESKERVISFSSLKPPSSPSKATGMEKLLNLGRGLLKGKKLSSSSPLAANGDNAHQLRLLHNRMIQWRFANARADIVHKNLTNDVERNLLFASDNLANLQRSVMVKRLQLQKEKLEMKLNFILHSQIKQLEAWGDFERQHSTALSKMKECLHSVVYRVPLTDGAKVDPHLTRMAFRQALDLTSSINSALTTSGQTEENAALLSQLAQVVSQEKLLLEECIELLQTMSTLEIQESSLKSYMIQLSQKNEHNPKDIVLQDTTKRS